MSDTTQPPPAPETPPAAAPVEPREYMSKRQIRETLLTWLGYGALVVLCLFAIIGMGFVAHWFNISAPTGINLGLAFISFFFILIKRPDELKHAEAYAWILLSALIISLCVGRFVPIVTLYVKELLIYMVISIMSGCLLNNFFRK